ncbi:MAG: hypothetical protein DRQ56_10370, partial [Gammaproteobacteria bacterium]
MYNKKTFKFIFFIAVMTMSYNMLSQINTNGNASNTIGNQNPFMDSSDFSQFPNDIGKGLYFPRTDLTIWVFNTAILDGITFATSYDGMIVYNTGTGITSIGQGVTVPVTPGFYYFYNPVILGFPDISSGKWLPIGIGGTGGVTVTTLSDNGDGTFTYTSEDGTITTFNAKGTLIDNADGTYTFTDAAGNVTTIDATEVITSTDAGNLLTTGLDGGSFINQTVIQANETLTTLAQSNATGIATYTDEDGATSTVDIISTDANNDIIVGVDGGA